ncbi:iron complex transport system substrate-binding protein [Roseivivax halotolerans]|uniref:Iron complex transport system substrate-binding protein n=1 Tax=Roseivivax halotolerans TaxID=93684 RepID=A0A1I6A616_9RHOB|nr:ABC transporter substrate-binding protein [Roseivivax halotolerans]SFQ64149.1 iron complex transport system substrate-binding protein [Roseivivax halotolerans]
MKRLLTTLAALAALAIPAAAQEMRTFTDALGREVEIPVDPQRIIAIHDLTITMPLVELGAPVVGSHGRVRDDGSTYLRSVNTIFNVDFDNSDIEFVGAFNQMDFEAMAALDPDLIIARAPWDEEIREQLEIVGPTVYVADVPEPFETYRQIADAAGMLPEFEARLGDYDALIEDARNWAPQLQGASYSKIQGYDGILWVAAGYGGLTQVLHALGMERTDFAQAMADRGVVWGEEVSAEVLPELEADYIFDTYRIDQDDTPQKAFDRLSDVFPGWCDLLSGCAQGRYILVPREHTGSTFRELEMLVHYVVSHTAGRPSISAPE